MTTTWTCRECKTENSFLVYDCKTCGAARPRAQMGSLLSDEVLQNTEGLGELRIALRQLGQKIEQMADSLGELWVQVDSLKARMDGVESRLDVIDDESFVTVAGTWLDNAQHELTYD